MTRAENNSAGNSFKIGLWETLTVKHLLLTFLLSQPSTIYSNFDKKIISSFQRSRFTELQIDYFDSDFWPRNDKFQTIKFRLDKQSPLYGAVSSCQHQMVNCDVFTKLHLDLT